MSWTPDLHEADNHAPFAHYHIVIAPTIVKVRDPQTKVINLVERGAEFIVCYFCGHWINRPLVKCACPASCHSEACLRVIMRVSWEVQPNRQP